MKSLARSLTIAATLGCLLTVTTARAFDGKQSAKTIAPYLDHSAIAVARIDLSKVDVAAVFKALPRYIPIPMKDAAETEKVISAFAAMLRAQKVTEVYSVISLTDFPGGQPFIIVPVRAGGSHRKVAGIFFSGNPDGPTERQADRRSRGAEFEICTKLGNVVFCGTRRTLKRLQSLKTPSTRRHLATAFDATAESAIQLAIVPSKDHHRVIAELMPRLPKSLGDMSGEELAKAIRWNAIGIQLPPALKVTIIVESQDNAGAKKLKSALFNVTKALKQNRDIKSLGIDVGELTTLLNPTVKENRLRMTFDAESDAGKKVIALFGGAVRQARKAAQRMSSKNNLKQFGIAMHNFHDVHKSFPPVASFNKKGDKKLLSWRVYMLPYLENAELFKQFHLNEPWDSAHNKKLIAKMPQVFADPAKQVKKPGLTRYMAAVGKNYIFDGQPEGLQIRDITDGTSNTILIVEAAPESAVVWTKPDDLQIDTKNPLKGLIGKDAKGFHATFADGSVRFLSKSIKLQTLRALFTRNGGEVVNE